uniref:Retrotransposon Copia-like N-terminal domain-containing protein n=1 Tax=Lactuca sativa TaxID=4236 RepID=A0A9R1WS89_LACSA|nr:hypothetical protein LSAT_V11C100033750 [Lactuca sativa]
MAMVQALSPKIPRDNSAVDYPSCLNWTSNDAHFRMFLTYTISGAENSTIDNPSYLNWTSNDSHVRMVLTSTISEAYFQHVQGKTSNDLWLAFKRACAPNKFDKRKPKSNCRSESRQEYVNALANIGEPIKDKDFEMLVIFRLREEYNGLKSYSIACSPHIAFNDLQVTLTITTIPQAFTASTGDSNRNLTITKNSTQLGFQLHPTSPQKFFLSQAPPPTYYAAQSSNNYCGNRRGNSRVNYKGHEENRELSYKFAWASTQKMVCGHCNRCGIGHLSSQCPNHYTNRSSVHANYAVSLESGSKFVASNLVSRANNHATSKHSTVMIKYVLEKVRRSLSFVLVLPKSLSPHKNFNLSHILHDASTHTIIFIGPSDNGLYSIRLPQLKSICKMLLQPPERLLLFGTNDLVIHTNTLLALLLQIVPYLFQIIVFYHYVHPIN